MPIQKKLLNSTALFWAIIFIPSFLFANTFNKLVEEKQFLENQFGIKTLECFPFKKIIGFTEEQIPMVEQCLKGVSKLKEALTQIRSTDYKEVGISNRFLKTSGFQTILIDWKASTSELTQFLNQNISLAEQSDFLNKIHKLKKEIARKGLAKELYCSKEISNTDCLAGYTTLAAVNIPSVTKRTGWHELMITHSSSPPEKPNKLVLGFNESSAEMQTRILKDPFETWRPKKKMYDSIQEKYGKVFKEQIKIENFICSADITPEECEKGALNLMEAGQFTDFRMRYWGKVILNRHNTIIEDDFNAQIRFDLSAEKILEHFSQKTIKTKADENTTLALKLENKTKNNFSRLRAVCDLEGLTSALCLKAFKTFIRFAKSNRNYKVALPWDTLMFIDGSQLKRVNFALNSKSRKTYLYIDANSSYKEFFIYLKKYQSGNYIQKFN
tara:strand:- start:3726 stop:5051 length:1326 start_codon:yes stop_codon:yes gene_type:complete